MLKENKGAPGWPSGSIPLHLIFLTNLVLFLYIKIQVIYYYKIVLQIQTQKICTACAVQKRRM